MERGRATLRWIIATAVVAFVGLTGGAGYIVAGTFVAARDQVAAHDEFERTSQDMSRIAGLVQAPDLPTAALTGGNPPGAPVRSGIQSDEAKIQEARALVAVDLPRLRRASATLATQTGSPLVVLERSPLGAERRRLDALATALGVAGRALAVADSQFQLVTAVMDTDAAYEPLLPKLDAGDFKSALELYPPIDAAVQKEVAMAAGPDIPPVLRSRASTDAASSADFKRILQADAISDWKTADALQPRLDGELNAASHLDGASVQTYDEQLFKGFQGRFDGAVKAAQGG